MNKRLFIFIVASLLTVTVTGQNPQKEIDTAEVVVSRYLNLMNIESLRRDSILYIESVIYHRSSPHDTAIMKRWYLPPNRMRSELWHGDTLLQGAYTDGKNIFKECDKSMFNGWTKVAMSRYYNIEPLYDFRGPLYHWKANAVDLTYKGIWHFNNNEVYRVVADSPNGYVNHYLFEKESGLLFFIEETNSHSTYSNHKAEEHPDWHAYHEYQPIGNAILPSIESYQMNEDVIFYFTKYRYIPIDMRIFTEDKP